MFKTLTKSVKQIAMAVCAVTMMTQMANASEISGAGATFPYPIYAKWATAYKAETDIRLNYQSIGSGGGIKQIKAKTVDFGASDMPLSVEDLSKNGLVQFPMVMGGVVPVVNLKGVKPGAIKLTGPVLANIYLGKITKWNDPALAQLNPGVPLPHSAITVVHRADGSGTTFIFTNYLSKISSDWAKVGVGPAVEWPAGLGGKGNEGVAALVGQTDGSIGYVEYAYAVQNKLIYTALKNRDGNMVEPTAAAFTAAAAHADWAHAEGFNLLLTDQAGKASWPITGATFILMHKVQDKPENAKAALKFFGWAYAKGAKMAADLDYIPMPDAVIKLVETRWHDIKDASGKPIL